MNIFEKITEILKKFPKISLVCNQINVDFTDNIPESYGLTSVGDNLIFEDVIGNQHRKQTFFLYSTFSGINDYERLYNSSAITELSIWLSEISDENITATVGGMSCNGKITKITAGNGKIYEIPNNDTYLIKYQLQIEVEYTLNLESEEF